MPRTHPARTRLSKPDRPGESEPSTDTRPAWWNLPGVYRLRQILNQPGFSRVYDLQTSDRSSFYFQLMWPHRPQWSGIAKGSSHPHDNPRRDFMHTIDRQREQLAFAGISDVPLPDLSWLSVSQKRLLT